MPYANQSPRAYDRQCYGDSSCQTNGRLDAIGDVSITGFSEPCFSVDEYAQAHVMDIGFNHVISIVRCFVPVSNEP